MNVAVKFTLGFAVVTGLFSGLVSADSKLADADRAQKKALDFIRLTTQREHSREAAQADVIKERLQEQQRIRELSNARIACKRACLELAESLFPDPPTQYSLDIPQKPI